MEVVLGVGSLVVLAGGLTAARRRAMSPGQAAGVLGIAIAVAGIAALAGWLGERLGRFYEITIVVPTTIAGIAMAVFLLTRPPRRIP